MIPYFCFHGFGKKWLYVWLKVYVVSKTKWPQAFRHYNFVWNQTYVSGLISTDFTATGFFPAHRKYFLNSKNLRIIPKKNYLICAFYTKMWLQLKTSSKNIIPRFLPKVNPFFSINIKKCCLSKTKIGHKRYRILWPMSTDRFWESDIRELATSHSKLQ